MTTLPDRAARTLPELAELVRRGFYGPDPARERIALAFRTTQTVRHAGRTSGYHNEVLSLRLEAAVGSCAVEPDELPATALDGCVGASVAELLDHPLLPVRIAALDAYLMRALPHVPGNGARPYPVPAGNTLRKSRARARGVVELLPVPAGTTVLVIGVVNSLIERLREIGVGYIPCDFKGGVTEWGEPISTCPEAALEQCDAILASGMTLGNGTFAPLLDHARATAKPLVMFAQTGSAILPRFLGAGVTAVSAEPYPFFWLDGGPGTIHRYRYAGGPK